MRRRRADLSCGRATSINILTATRGWVPWLNQRFNLRLASLDPWMVRLLTRTPPQTAQLKRLNFLHSAGWYAVGRFPRAGGPRESRQRRWMLFCSNFNQSWESYVQSFLDVLADGIYTTWGSSLDFPAFPNPGSRYEMVEWYETKLVPTQHYYSAYPWAATSDVRASLRAGRELIAFALGQSGLQRIVGSSTPHDSNRRRSLPTEVEGLVVRLQHCIVPLDLPAELPQVALAPTTANGMGNVVSLLPIAAGREQAVLDALQHLSEAPSPFQRIAGTHFARLAVIDRNDVGRAHQQGFQLRRSWLVLAADYDHQVDGRRRAERRPQERSERHRFLSSVMAAPGLSEVWDACGLPISPSHRDELAEEGVVRPMILFQDYPDRTLREVLDALDVVRSFVDLLLDRAGSGADTAAGVDWQQWVRLAVEAQEQLDPKADHRQDWRAVAGPILNGARRTAPA